MVAASLVAGMTDRRVDRDTVDHADAVTGASKNASDVFIVVEDAVLLVDSVASEETCPMVVLSICGATRSR